MVVSDMVTHTLARQKGFDAFLITSGVENLHDAFTQPPQTTARARRRRAQTQRREGVARSRSGTPTIRAAGGGNQTAAARQLGISRTTLWRYLNPKPAKKTPQD